MTTLPQRLGLAAAALLPTLALAHTGADAPHVHDAFFNGLLHPLTGIDHLAAMLALGIWSALTVRPAALAPAAFVLLLATGALAGSAGLAVPAVEPMIAVSLLVIGLLLARRQRLPLAASAALAGGFAFFHGVAHGSELAAGGAPALAGMLVGTALLLLTGLALGRYLLHSRRTLSTAAGGAVALLGSALLLGLA